MKSETLSSNAVVLKPWSADHQWSLSVCQVVCSGELPNIPSVFFPLNNVMRGFIEVHVIVQNATLMVIFVNLDKNCCGCGM